MKCAARNAAEHNKNTTLAEKTHIPEDTLKTWRKRRRADPTWLPSHGSPGSPKILHPETEQALKIRVVREFIEKETYLSRQHLKMMAVEEWREQARRELEKSAEMDYLLEGEGQEVQTPRRRVVTVPVNQAAVADIDDVDQDELPPLDLENIPIPKFSNRWIRNFEKRQGLSYRTPSLQRRSAPNDEYVASWLQEVEVALQSFQPNCIWNVDETCLRIINGKLKTISLRGNKEVRVKIDFDMKQAITVVAACSSDGGKMPLVVLAKGTTEACERSYRDDKRLRSLLGHSLLIDHTKKGWANHDFAKRYLKILSKHMKKRWIFVLWDVHSSHRKDTVKEYARDHKIQLSYIPAGQTGYWQPLDRSIFGLFKKKTQAELERLALTKDLAEIDMIDTLVTLTNVWNSLDPETIARSWKHIVAE